jgi:hypothetical protein
MTRPDPAPEPMEGNRARIRAWLRTGTLSALWPDVDPGDLRAAQTRVREVTGALLAHAGADAPPHERAALAGGDERRLRALGVAAFLAGMGPLLGWWIERGTLGAPEPVRALFAGHLEHGRRRVARLRGETDRVVASMGARGVEPVVLKGLHTGADYFPEPGTRPAADVDLLVGPGERDAAADALRAAGFAESRRTRFAARSEWSPAGAPTEVRSLELDHADNPFTIDLHTRLERWYFRGLRRGLHPAGAAPATRPSAALVVDGRPARVLAEPYLTAFLALHASHDPTRMQLVRLVELALVLRADARASRLDPGELAALLRSTDTLRFVHPALELVDELAPGTVERGLLEQARGRATARTLRVVDELRAAGMAPPARPTLDAKLMWARGPRELLLNLSELVLPSDDGLPVGLLRLQWRRLAALASGRAGWRAGRRPDSLGG